MRSHSEDAFPAKGKEQASLKGADVGDYWSREQGEPRGSGFHPGPALTSGHSCFPEPFLLLHIGLFCSNGIEWHFPRLQQ